MNWFSINAHWAIPIIVTIIFSIINTILSIINFKQTKTMKELQQDQFCYDLMEQRLYIYEAVNRHLVKCISEGNADISWFKTYRKETRNSNFLFGEDIRLILDRIYKLASELHTVESKINHNINDPPNASQDHAQLCDRSCELMTEISDLSQNLRGYFIKYIDFSNYTIRSSKRRSN